MDSEIVEHRPPPTLAPHIARYSGYSVRLAGPPVRQREVPTGRVVVIIGFGSSLVLDGPTGGMRHTSFTSGPNERAAVIDYDSDLDGIQLSLEPLGAYRLFGMPMSELASTVVELDELDHRQRWDKLAVRLAEAPGWRDRFVLLDTTLQRWAAENPPGDAAVSWAWRQLERSHGAIPVGSLAAEIGWSRRHFGARFREQVGLGPKATASLLRFKRAVTLLDVGVGVSIGDIAAASGYADHSHLDREFRRLAGCTPSAYLAEGA